MTRGKWVALAVGLAVIVVLIPYGPALWRAVAYVEERMENSSKATILSDADASYLPEYVVLTRKRFNWVPGPVLTTRCPWCAESDHARCPGKRKMLVFLPLGQDRVQGRLHPCDCPHPSHAQESE